LIGNNYYNYVIDSSGIASNNSITPALLTSNFYSLGKVYNRNSYAPVAYNISGYFAFDLQQIDISAIWMANYRNVNTGTNYIDISNIKLFGSLAYNYVISNYTTISGLISNRYLYVTGIDKNYDRSMLANITISNLVGNDTITYFAQYDDYNVGSNKNIYVSLSSIVVGNNPLDSDSAIVIRYRFNIEDEVMNTVYNFATSSYAGSLVNGAILSTTLSVIGNASLYLNGNSYMNLGTNIIHNTGISILFWLQSNSTSVYPVILSGTDTPNPNGTNNGRIYQLSLSSNILFINNNNTGLSINDGIMRHIGIVVTYYNLTNCYYQIYINGLVAATLSGALFYPNNTIIYNFIGTLGWAYGGVNNYINAYIDDFRMYNRTLSSSEVLALYNYIPIITVSNKNNNYQIFDPITSGNIFQRYLKATYTGLTKVYNANTQGQSIYTISGIYTGDIIDISNIYLTNFANIYVGSNIPIYISNVTLTGTNYYNYVIDSSGIASNSNITPALLNGNFYSLGKTYDKTSYAPVYYNLSGLFSNDANYVDISHIWIANYRNVNTGLKYIDISNIKIFGSLAYNYFIPNYTTISGLINPKYVIIKGNDKNYDSTTVATITISGLINTDMISYIANFNNKYAAPNKLITAMISLSGSVNYVTYQYNFSNVSTNTNLWSSNPLVLI
jgi:hypothetical protein